MGKPASKNAGLPALHMGSNPQKDMKNGLCDKLPRPGMSLAHNIPAGSQFPHKGEVRVNKVSTHRGNKWLVGEVF